MSERKVLNKYYPADYDPSKIPKVRQEKNRQWSIRIMAPFNMRCNTCGEYIYKGKKFNSKKEDVEDDDYLGLKIFRFYIKCPRCVAEIAFKTDPKNTDYELEGGATRNFEALRTAEQLAQQKAKEKEEEEANNPMKVLENRTKASQREMDMIETLEELREMNARHSQVDHNKMLALHEAYGEQLQRLMEEEDEKFVNSLFGKSAEGSVKRLAEDDEEPASSPPKKILKPDKPTDILMANSTSKKPIEVPSWQKSVGSLSTKTTGLVKKKALLVKPKQSQASDNKTEGAAKEESQANGNKTQAAAAEQTVVGSNGLDSQKSESNANESKQNDCDGNGGDVNTKTQGQTVASGLGLLGNYSDSDSGSSSE